MKIAVFASGNGSNFEAVTMGVKEGKISGEMTLLVVDKKKAFALERAKRLDVEALLLSPAQFEDKASYEEALLKALAEKGIELIVLAGYMRILSPTIVRAYEHKIVNIHPSLLPKYKGKDVIEKAFFAKEAETGVTVHYVDEGMDTGEIILQESLKIEDTWSLEKLEEEIHKIEHRLYPLAIEKVIRES